MQVWRVLTTPPPQCPCQPPRHTLASELPNVLLTWAGSQDPQKTQPPDQLFLLIRLDSRCEPGIYSGKPQSREGPVQFVQKLHQVSRVDLVSEKGVWNKCVFLYESFNIRREIRLIAIDLYTWLFVWGVTVSFIGRWKQRRRREKIASGRCRTEGRRKSISRSTVGSPGWHVWLLAHLLCDPAGLEGLVAVPGKEGQWQDLPHRLWVRFNQFIQLKGWAQRLLDYWCSTKWHWKAKAHVLWPHEAKALRVFPEVSGQSLPLLWDGVFQNCENGALGFLSPNPNPSCFCFPPLHLPP